MVFGGQGAGVEEGEQGVVCEFRGSGRVAGVRRSWILAAFEGSEIGGSGEWIGGLGVVMRVRKWWRRIELDFFFFFLFFYGVAVWELVSRLIG